MSTDLTEAAIKSPLRNMLSSVSGNVAAIVRSVSEGDASLAPEGKVASQVVNTATVPPASVVTSIKHTSIDHLLSSRVRPDGQVGRASAKVKDSQPEAVVVDDISNTKAVMAVPPNPDMPTESIGELVAGIASQADPSNSAEKQLRDDFSLVERVSRSEG